MYKLYKIILEENESVSKMIKCGKSVTDVRRRFGANKKVLTIEDITEEHPINQTKLKEALTLTDFDDSEIDAIIYLMSNFYQNVV